MNGKGDDDRTRNFKAYWDNLDAILKKKRKSENDKRASTKTRKTGGGKD